MSKTHLRKAGNLLLAFCLLLSAFRSTACVIVFGSPLIQQIAVHPQTPMLVLGVASGGSLYRSDDGGKTWSLSGEGLPTERERIEITKIAFAPSNPRILYAGTLHGLWRSADAGKTWQPPLSVENREPYNRQPSPNGTVYALAVHPTNPNVVAISANDAIHRSIDGGKTWLTAVEPHSIETLLFDPENPKILFAAGTGSLSKSMDGGPWQIVLQNSPSRIGQLWPRYLASGGKPSRIFVSDDSLSSYSEDHGSTWHPLPGACGVIAISSSDNSIVSTCKLESDGCFTSRGNFLRSTDAGMHWQSIGAGLPEQLNSPMKLSIHPTKPEVIFATLWNHTLYRTEDGGKTWSEGMGLEYPKSKAR